MPTAQEEFEMDMAEEMRVDAAEEHKHQYRMHTDVDYAQNYLDGLTDIRSRLGQLKTLCDQYDLDFTEVLDAYKDEE